jgi:catechol 2,3-dioxygenase-like lactoylglutathione lyase family enzyme
MYSYRSKAIDHINLAVSDLDRSRAFYTAALGAIGIKEMLRVGPEHGTESGGRMVGYGDGRKPFFWILEGKQVGENTHIAFAVETRAEVATFYAAALAAGGKDHGAPGLRKRYHADYYGAFVLDSDGINVEVVCHNPE